MKKSWKERTIQKLVHFGKNHKLLKFPLMVVVFMVLGVGYVIEKLCGNTKKLVSLACLALFFMISSSFASIGFIQTSDIPEKNNMVSTEIETEGVALAASSGEEVPVIEDDDVIDGYEDSNLEDANTDFYSVDEILNENQKKETADGDSMAAEKREETATIDRDDWRLLLINKQHPIPDGYEFKLGTIKGNMKCDERIIDDLLLMLQGAKDDGVDLVICSPYRDMNRQEVLFNRKIALYMKNGMSYLEAYKTTAQAVTVPGASEHQIGLALDIICDSYSQLNAGFGDTEAGKWLAKHSCEYGFILRYPRGKEYITSIEYEPWHFRYVGKDAAMEITSRGITLEEYVENL
ncbi:MAG: M15 family metallopeptidase [Lachnospiraceae bacterium]|nr:M15 family metallopeptidase [Lachnospiraceae bacterium]